MRLFLMSFTFLAVTAGRSELSRRRQGDGECVERDILPAAAEDHLTRSGIGGEVHRSARVKDEVRLAVVADIEERNRRLNPDRAVEVLDVSSRAWGDAVAAGNRQRRPCRAAVIR